MKYSCYLILLIFLLISCEKLLKEDEQNTLHLETTDDYNEAMSGLYNRLFNSIIGGEDLLLQSTTLIESIGNGDDLSFITSIPIFLDQYGHHVKPPMCIACYFDLSCNVYKWRLNCNPYIAESADYPEDFTHCYKLLYQTIGSANNILSKAGDIDELEPNFRKIIGEVFFIRAYSYFRLARVHGQVPLVTNTDIDFTIAKPSFREIYNLIESDLLKAMGLLPTSNNEARVPYTTPHIGVVKALLAEVYLTMGGYPLYDESKYADAAKIAGEVIDSATYFGFGLMPDLADLWNGKHIKNQESEFAIYYGSIDKINNESENPDPDYYSFLSADFRFQQYPDRDRFYVPADFYNSFPINYRKEITFEPIPEYSIYDTIDYCTKIHYNKFYTYTGHVVYILRYAQTLLTYAEAKARSGAADASAYEAINQVRRRANNADLFSPSPYDLKPGLTMEQFADSVVQERAWELCAEPEGRWFDMVRLEIAKDLVKIKHHQGVMVYPVPIDTNTYFVPIPEKDRKLNPNL